MNQIFEKWLNSVNVSEDIKLEMKKMSPKDIEYSFSDEPLVFGTAGYRNKIGPGNKYMNIFTYQQLAIAYATFIKRRFYKKSDQKNKKPRVVVGHDNRKGNIEFTNAVVNALTNCGIEVLIYKDNQPMFTPIISYTIRKLKLDGGINITASHNPKEYNGFKVYNSNGGQLLPHECNMVSSFIPSWEDNLKFNYTTIPNMVSLVQQSVINSYLNSITNTLIHNQSKFKNDDPIIFTAHHGVGCEIAADYLRSLGHNIIDVNEQNFYDSDFINSPLPNPEDSDSFKKSIEIASKNKSNIAIALDPDGDRFAIAIRHNKKWRYLNGNETGVLLTYYLLNYMKKDERVPIVISTHVSNNLINKIAEDHSAIILRTGTGFKYIAKAIDEIDENGKFVIGFEEAIGSCTNQEIRDKDGLSTAAIVLDMVDFYKSKNMDLIDVLEKRIFPAYGQWYSETVSIKINGTNWKEEAMKIEERAMNLRIKKVGKLPIKDILWNEDGECIEWVIDDDSWIKFRISGTEPKFKIYLNLYFDNSNTDDYYSFEEMAKAADALIHEIKSTLKI